MTDPTGVSLDEVRTRFLEAQARLGDAANAIRSIEDAAAQVGAARGSLTAAGEQIRGLAGQFGDVASALSENADELRRGVDAIRLGDPAAVRRQIEELDAAFTAMQSVMAERFTGIEASNKSFADRLESVRRAQASARLESRLMGGLTLAVSVAVLVLLLLR